MDAIRTEVLTKRHGSTKMSSDLGKQYNLLYLWLDLTTSLDPRFNVAYSFGLSFLAEPLPGGGQGGWISQSRC